MEVSGQLHSLAALPWGKSPQYLLDRRHGGPQGQSVYSGGDNLQPLPGIKPQLSILQPSHYTD